MKKPGMVDYFLDSIYTKKGNWKLPKQHKLPHGTNRRKRH